MTTKTRFPLGLAELVAEKLSASFVDAGLRAVIAGSIRRRKPEVGDIEILVEQPSDEIFDKVDGVVQNLMQENILAKRQNAKGSYTYGPKNKLLIHCATGIPVDIFTTAPDN